MEQRILLTRSPRGRMARPRQWLGKWKSWWIFRTRTKDVYLCYFPFRGFVWYRVCRRGGRWQDAIATVPFPSFSMKRVKPIVAGVVAGPTHLAAMETDLFDSYPNLTAHCAVTRYDDGTPRRPGWCLLGTYGTNWTLTVKDVDGDCQLRFIAPRLDDVYAMADLALGSEDAPWEPCGEYKGKKKGR